MKRLKEDLLSVSKAMAKLTERIDIITKKLETYKQSETREKRPVASPKNKPVPEATPKPSKESKPSKAPEASSAIDTVLEIVNQSKDGVSVDALRKETRFESKKIHGILYKLKKRGQITSEKKGVYTKA